ncbi:MAG: LysR family transcriptional regulator [Promethearchaeia archaeon]
MKISYIRNFIKLVKTESFSKLATNISISQSTLSHQIMQLEENFHVKLIDRTTRKFRLTKAGEIFLKYAEEIIDLIDNCRAELSGYSDTLMQDIQISASTIPGSHILPKYFTKFKNEHPHVNFKVSINNSKSSLAKLSKDLVTFVGIGSFLGHSKREYDYISIGNDKIVIICAPDHELLENDEDRIEFEALKEFPWVNREPGSGTRNFFEQQFPRHKELDFKLEINDNDSIISAVTDSNYISYLSNYVAQKAEDAGLIKILNIKEESIIAEREIYLVKQKNKKLKEIEQKFWNFIADI